jgi:carboxylesterase type B
VFEPQHHAANQHPRKHIRVCPRGLLAGSSSLLPVFVFFHGRALVGDSQSIQIAGREIYDGASLVRTSIAEQQPLIVVTANYRLGPLGFLASEELVADNNNEQQAGQPTAAAAAGNYGLHDQRRVLEWCSRYVAGFGGDPRNVTIQGSSAGGTCVTITVPFLAAYYRTRRQMGMSSQSQQGSFNGPFWPVAQWLPMGLCP